MITGNKRSFTAAFVQGKRAREVIADTESDGIDKDRSRVTEMCFGICPKLADPKHKKVRDFFVGYNKAPGRPSRAFSQKVPQDGPGRQDPQFLYTKAAHYISAGTRANEIPVIEAYNSDWDEALIRRQIAELHVNDFPEVKFFDFSRVMQALGYPMGTTQFEIEKGLSLPPLKLPANRHRAYADVRVLGEIRKRLLMQIKNDPILMAEWEQLLLQENAEQLAAEFLLRHDPTLAPSAETLQRIADRKAREKRIRESTVMTYQIYGYDTETSGLPIYTQHHNRPAEIIELSAKKFNDDTSTPAPSFDTLIKCRGAVDEGARAVHHIDEEKLATAPAMHDALGSFMTWLNTTSAPASDVSGSGESPVIRPILVGYNSSDFDDKLLMQAGLEHGIDFKRMNSSKEIGYFDAIWFVRSYFGKNGRGDKLPSQKLQQVANHLEIDYTQTHRALSDVELLELILREMCAPFSVSHVIALAMEFTKSTTAANAIVWRARFIMEQHPCSPMDALSEACAWHRDQLAMQPDEEEVAEATATARSRGKKAAKKVSTQDFVIDSQGISQEVLNPGFVPPVVI